MPKASRFSLVLRIALAAAVLLPASVGVWSQDTAAAMPDGAKARSVFELQPQHMTLSVANVKAERDWYVEKLGFTMDPPVEPSPTSPSTAQPEMQMAHVKIPGYRLDLIQFTGSQRPKDASPRYLTQGWVHIAFTATNLDKALSFLEAAGTDVKGSRDDKGSVTRLLLHDPEGNEIEIFPQ